MHYSALCTLQHITACWRGSWPRYLKSKTKTLGFEETEPVINLDGEIVEAVNHFRYLGSEVMPSGRLDEELRTRIGRASATFGQLFKIWRSKISFKSKLRIYNAVVISTLLYGSETWATTWQ